MARNICRRKGLAHSGAAGTVGDIGHLPGGCRKLCVSVAVGVRFFHTASRQRLTVRCSGTVALYLHALINSAS